MKIITKSIQKIPILLILLIPVVILTGCPFGHDHHRDLPPQIDLVFHHLAGEDTLELDKQIYTNAAGNRFSVTNLEYYISEILIKDDQGEDLHLFDDIVYVNAEDEGTHRHTLMGIGEEHGHTLHFVFGLLPEKNVRESLPNTEENIIMRWPDHMGGGYHFLKMEGHFEDSTGTNLGYATHIGNDNKYQNHFNYSAPTAIHQNFADNTIVTINIYMDILEWYQGPNEYDLNEHVEVMGRTVPQTRLKENGSEIDGSKGVFSVGEITLTVLEGGSDNHDHDH